ncbi:hypothetical protein F485_gp286 [Aeromonas phage CC2]|uniref:Uncharacterized protein n=1 Tax=Aeromonas phage CC2 TaxID=1204516 RepID=I6XGI0_9CAUD|nr:hypothetical protein F485_gp286 [Aeromonas phage CC2]AFN39166.1 hypothetical protein CC2_009 [Aeromonas phage CC2]
MSSGKAVLRNAAKQARWERNTSRLIKKYLLRGYDGEFGYNFAKDRFVDLIRKINYVCNLHQYEKHTGIGRKIDKLCTKKGIDTKLFNFSKCMVNGPFLFVYGHSKEFLKFLDLIDIKYDFETIGEPRISIILNQNIGDKVNKFHVKKPVSVSTETITVPYQSKSEFEYIKDTIDNIIKEKAIAENKVIFLNSQLEEAKGMMRRLVKDYI